MLTLQPWLEFVDGAVMAAVCLFEWSALPVPLAGFHGSEQNGNKLATKVPPGTRDVLKALAYNEQFPFSKVSC
jgi:hypothetical protein